MILNQEIDFPKLLKNVKDNLINPNDKYNIHNYKSLNNLDKLSQILNQKYSLLANFDDFSYFTNKNKNLLIKIGSYNDQKINDFTSPINNDIIINQLLNPLQLSNKINHLLLNYQNLDIDKENILDLIKKSKKNLHQSKYYLKTYYFNDKIIPLSKYLKDHQINNDLLLFQLIHTAINITQEFPNLHLVITQDNLFIENNNNNSKLKKYFIDNKYYYLPNTFKIYLTNFENAEINSNKKYINFLNQFKVYNKNLIKEFHKKFKSFSDKKYVVKLLNNHQSLDKSLDKSIDNKSLDKSLDKSIDNIEPLSDLSDYNLIQSGGDGGIISSTLENPNLSMDAKRTFGKQKSEMPSKREPPVILEQKLYDTSKPSGSSGSKYPPTQFPVNLEYPYNMLYANMHTPKNFPIQKIYNVSMANPTGNHEMLNLLFQDIIPNIAGSLTFNSLSERNELIRFISSSINKIANGETMALTPNIFSGEISILSYLKLTNLNPYRTLIETPYTSLPDNFLLYQAGYPVKYNPESNKVELQSDAIPINIRLYKLDDISRDTTTIKLEHDIDIKDLAIIDNKIKLDFKSLDVDIKNLPFHKRDSPAWKDLDYYKKIRQEIIIPKKSPHFINLISWKIDYDSKIQYDKLKQLGETFDKDTINILINDITNYLNNHTLRMTKVPSLMLLTEAPTQSLINWGSLLYQDVGSVKKIVQTGFHSKEIWKNILFQLITVFYSFSKLKIAFNEFELERNIFIKDTNINPNQTGYWKYIINNIEFYLPNKGYIIMVDSSFKSEYTNINYNDLLKKQLKNILDELTELDKKIKTGFLQLPTEIITLIKKINENIDENKDYDNILVDLFSEYLNNRLGSNLNNQEKDNIIRLFTPNFRRGEIVIHQERFSDFKFVLYLQDVASYKVKIVTKDISGNFTTIEIPKGAISKFNPLTLVEQIFDEKKELMTENELIETYNLD